MENIFLSFVNRSITASWLILVVIALRLLLKRTPKWTHCLLWAFVAFRLACPFSLESVFSLIPSRETIRHEAAVSSSGQVFDSGVEFVDNAVNNVVNNAMNNAVKQMEQEPASLGHKVEANPLQSWLFAAAVIWIAGMAILLLYALVTYVRLWLKIRTAVRLEGQVMVSEFVDTPFVFGVIRPRIYLPSHMAEELKGPVIAHELAHLERRDNLWKILGYVLLTVYWFNPLCWAAYILLGRDIELACDEKVIRGYSMRQKKQYSEALLACSMDRRAALVCPLAFGEVGVKARIKSVLHYRKPAFWAMAAAMAICAVAAVCFLTDPVREEEGSGALASAGAEGENGSVGSVNVNGGDGAGNDSINGSGTDNNGAGAYSSGQNDAEAAAQAALREEMVREWTKSFVERNGNAMEPMVSASLAAEMLDGPAGQRSFGVSSPWPRDAASDVRVLSVGEESAQILYYAWTSDPHVSVWKEEITYEFQDGSYIVTAEDLIYLDNISTRQEFEDAYCYVSIDGSAMDYESNGAGESLNANALMSSSMAYRSLFQPESAAVALLNLSDDPSKVKIERIYEETGSVNLYITFPAEESDLPMALTMVQLYGPDGIWIPKDHRLDPMARLVKLDWDEVRGKNLHVNGNGTYEWTEDISCIAEIPSKNIRIYGYADAECSCHGVAIEIGDDVNYFDWYYTTTQGLLPDCHWDERRRQLQVALLIYTGTGVSAQELHVLQYYDTGTLTDSALEINDYWDMLQERIGYTFEKETRRLTLFDTEDGKELASLEIEEDSVESLELGNISRFILGETIWLSLDPGYFPEHAAIASYPEDMPRLEFELVSGGSEGEIPFSLGEIRVVDSQDGTW